MCTPQESKRHPVLSLPGLIRTATCLLGSQQKQEKEYLII